MEIGTKFCSTRKYTQNLPTASTSRVLSGQNAVTPWIIEEQPWVRRAALAGEHEQKGRVSGTHPRCD